MTATSHDRPHDDHHPDERGGTVVAADTDVGSIGVDFLTLLARDL